MVGCGCRHQRVAAQRFVCDERGVVAREEKCAHALLETHGPVERLDRMTAPGVCVQVVDDVAATHDEHALVAQRREALRRLVVKLRAFGLVNAQLHDGHVRAGEDVTED